ncbi:MAG: hypothetical protein IPP72_21640 [Chitinophagaceae bacterium]|nr:hypothetical protein [Chitinophagaceae bacterium]
MKKWFSKNKLYVIGGFVGAIAGFAYWNFVGCSSGTCMISSKPINSTLYGAAIGSLTFGMFQKKDKSSVSSPQNNTQ